MHVTPYEFVDSYNLISRRAAKSAGPQATVNANCEVVEWVASRSLLNCSHEETKALRRKRRLARYGEGVRGWIRGTAWKEEGSHQGHQAQPKSGELSEKSHLPRAEAQALMDAICLDAEWVASKSFQEWAHEETKQRSASVLGRLLAVTCNSGGGTLLEEEDLTKDTKFTKSGLVHGRRAHWGH